MFYVFQFSIDEQYCTFHIEAVSNCMEEELHNYCMDEFLCIIFFRRSWRFSAGVVGFETIFIDENLSPTTKGTHLVKNDYFFHILGQCQLDSRFESNCSKFSKFLEIKLLVFWFWCIRMILKHFTQSWSHRAV